LLKNLFGSLERVLLEVLAVEGKYLFGQLALGVGNEVERMGYGLESWLVLVGIALIFLGSIHYEYILHEAAIIAHLDVLGTLSCHCLRTVRQVVSAVLAWDECFLRVVVLSQLIRRLLESWLGSHINELVDVERGRIERNLVSISTRGVRRQGAIPGFEDGALMTGRRLTNFGKDHVLVLVGF
jgi:hypothetical protein